MKYFFINLIAIFFLISCQKEATVKQEEIVSENQSFRKRADDNKLCVCHGYELRMSGGEFSCPSGDGCAKIQSCPCKVAAGIDNGQPVTIFLEADFIKFQEELNNKRLINYFNANEWRKLFPELKNNPELLEKLRNGDVTFVERKNEQTGSIFYLAIPSEYVDSEFSASEVRMALELPNDIIKN
jgi:hypothetical protein